MCGTVSHGGTNDNRIAAALDRLTALLDHRLPPAHSSISAGNVEWTDDAGTHHTGYQYWDSRDQCWRGGPHGHRPE